MLSGTYQLFTLSLRSANHQTELAKMSTVHRVMQQNVYMPTVRQLTVDITTRMPAGLPLKLVRGAEADNDIAEVV